MRSGSGGYVRFSESRSAPISPDTVTDMNLWMQARTSPQRLEFEINGILWTTKIALGAETPSST